MAAHKSFKDLYAEIENTDGFLTESAILDFTVELNRLMTRRNLTKKDFAKNLGTSQAYITRVFKGDANFTIASMVKLVNALEGKVEFHISPKEEKNVQWWKVLPGGKLCSPSSEASIPSWTHGMIIESDLSYQETYGS